jgi:hypothetical protein
MLMTNSAKGLSAAAALLLISLVLPPSVPAANVAVPSLELVTRGFMDGNLFELATYSEIDLAYDGGMKFGGRIAFTYLNSHLELPSASSLTLKGLSFTIDEPFSLPASFSWFIGSNDILCSGESFTAVFGSQMIASHYSGYMYFPEGVIYDGIYTVKGTGARFEYTPVKESLLFSLYVYEDTHFVVDVPTLGTVLFPGIYSADFRALMDFGAVKIESFIGATYASFPSTLGFYRGGILFYAGGGETVEFMAQIGIPQYDPGTSPAFTINFFYLLVEPRLHLGFFSLIPTFFLHPGAYEQMPTEEAGSFDINLDMFLGNVDEYGFRGGLESNVRFAGSTNSFRLVESPYVSFVSFGLLWDLKINVAITLPFSLSNFSGFVGIRAEF